MNNIRINRFKTLCALLSFIFILVFYYKLGNPHGRNNNDASFIIDLLFDDGLKTNPTKMKSSFCGYQVFLCHVLF